MSKDNIYVQCGKCKGTGKITQMTKDGEEYVFTEIDCPDCSGSGEVIMGRLDE